MNEPRVDAVAASHELSAGRPCERSQGRPIERLLAATLSRRGCPGRLSRRRASRFATLGIPQDITPQELRVECVGLCGWFIALRCERGRRRDWLDRRAELLVELLNRGERLVVEGKADGLAGFRREIRGKIGLHHAARAFRRHHRRLVPQYALEEV